MPFIDHYNSGSAESIECLKSQDLSMRTSDLGVKFMKTPGTCCLGDAIRWTPVGFGDRLDCSGCGNRLTAKERKHKSYEIDTEGRYTPAEGYEVQSVAFSRDFWSDHRIDDHMETLDLETDGLMKSHQVYVYHQSPPDWYEDLQIVKTGPGMLFVYGRRDDEFAEETVDFSDLGEPEDFTYSRFS